MKTIKSLAGLAVLANVPTSNGNVTVSHNSETRETVAAKPVQSYTDKQVNDMGKLLIRFEHADDRTEDKRRADMVKMIRAAFPQHVDNSGLAAQMTSEGRKAIPADVGAFIGKAVKMLQTALELEGLPTTRVNSYRRTLQDSFFGIVAPKESKSLTKLEFLEAKRKADAEAERVLTEKLKLEAEKAQKAADEAKAKADAGAATHDAPIENPVITVVDTVPQKAESAPSAGNLANPAKMPEAKESVELAQTRTAVIKMAQTLKHVFAILKTRDASLVTFVQARLLATEKEVVQNVLNDKVAA